MRERKLWRAILPAAAAITLAGAATALGVFGTAGRTIVNVGGTNSADDVAIAKDGKIVGVGAAVPGSEGFDLAVVRLTGAGVPDGTFSGDGEQTTALGSVAFDTLDAVAVQKDLAIVAGGSSNAIDNQTRATLIRYEPDGDPDPTFSDDGHEIYSFDDFSDVQDLALQKDGKIVIAGSVSSGGNGQDALVARIKPNGKVDKEFGKKGVVRFGVKKGTGLDAVAIQKDGGIVVAGDTSGTSIDSKGSQLFARVTKGGKLDGSFSDDGIFTRKEEGASSRIEDVAIAKNGGVLGVVGIFDGPDQAYGISAVKENGKKDKKFGKNGLALRDFGDDTSLEDLGVQESGSIVVSGAVRSGDLDFLLARFTRRGKLDESFGFKGASVTDFNAGSLDIVQGLAIAKDDTIVAAGIGDGDFGFARYLAGGDIDD